MAEIIAPEFFPKDGEEKYDDKQGVAELFDQAVSNVTEQIN